LVVLSHISAKLRREDRDLLLEAPGVGLFLWVLIGGIVLVRLVVIKIGKCVKSGVLKGSECYG